MLNDNTCLAVGFLPQETRTTCWPIIFPCIFWIASSANSLQITQSVNNNTSYNIWSETSYRALSARNFISRLTFVHLERALERREQPLLDIEISVCITRKEHRDRDIIYFHKLNRPCPEVYESTSFVHWDLYVGNLSKLQKRLLQLFFGDIRIQVANKNLWQIKMIVIKISVLN